MNKMAKIAKIAKMAKIAKIFKIAKIARIAFRKWPKCFPGFYGKCATLYVKVNVDVNEKPQLSTFHLITQSSIWLWNYAGRLE